MMYVSQVIILYTLNLNSDVCQLYLQKIKKKKDSTNSHMLFIWIHQVLMFIIFALFI